MVTVIEPGRIVRVGPDELDADDIIDFAGAIIDEQGWVQATGGDENTGWSIHGAIGEAARRATGSSAKDSGTARPLRDEAKAKVEAANPQLGNELEINDTAADKDDALARLRAGKGVVV